MLPQNLLNELTFAFFSDSGYWRGQRHSYGTHSGVDGQVPFAASFGREAQTKGAKHNLSQPITPIVKGTPSKGYEPFDNIGRGSYIPYTGYVMLTKSSTRV